MRVRITDGVIKEVLESTIDVLEKGTFDKEIIDAAKRLKVRYHNKNDLTTDPREEIDFPTISMVFSSYYEPKREDISHGFVLWVNDVNYSFGWGIWLDDFTDLGDESQAVSKDVMKEICDIFGTTFYFKIKELTGGEEPEMSTSYRDGRIDFKEKIDASDSV